MFDKIKNTIVPDNSNNNDKEKQNQQQNNNENSVFNQLKSKVDDAADTLGNAKNSILEAKAALNDSAL